MIGSLTFLTPLILTALIGLPLLWRLMRLAPPPPQRAPFPAFVILRDLKDAEQTPAKTPWPLLLLRLFIAALIIVGLAGPILNAPQTASASRPILVVVDDSWAAAPGWRLRRNAMIEAAEAARARDVALRLLTTTTVADATPPAPMTPSEFEARAAALEPSALTPDYAAAGEKLAALAGAGAYDVRWLRDGLEHDGAAAFANALANLGSLNTVEDRASGVLALTAPREAAQGAPAYRVDRVGGTGDWSGEVAALARDGRELARAAVDLAAGERFVRIDIDLPLALRNEVARAALLGAPSAGAVRLQDGRERRAIVGVPAGEEGRGDALLAGAYYARTALAPFAAFIEGDIKTLAGSAASVIILDDVGRLRPGDAVALGRWVQKGGVLIRFAGPSLADAAQSIAPDAAPATGSPPSIEADAPPTLLPAPLRGGGRAFGGALTWETPQKLGPFAADGPFAGLTPPDDVLVRRQVLAAPGGATSAATWASLADGTPLVTGVRNGDGAIALFHVTASPAWSDLPLSNVFVEMLTRLSFLSVVGAASDEADPTARHAPLRLLDGYGVLKAPPATLGAVTLADAEAGPSAFAPPGLYGSRQAPFAVNAVDDAATLAPARGYGARTGYVDAPPRRLARPLFALAALLFAVDALASLWISGRLRFGARPLGAAASLFAAFIALAHAPPAHAQAPAPIQAPAARAEAPLDAPINDKARRAALETRFAFVRTGDPSVDRLSALGLAALSRELARRTALEPAAPESVDPETDDLSIYPLIYWPVTPAAEAPSAVGLANIETFMRFGGLIIFDTRDDERAFVGVDTPEQIALRSILSGLDTPPLQPLPNDHVLTRSFYLLGDLVGRMADNPIWVQAGGEANDAVTPLIIGGRDWAGAWASDEAGRPVLPPPPGGATMREYAMRAGVNIVMVALTGNYKSDQVHTPILLQRLGN